MQGEICLYAILGTARLVLTPIAGLPVAPLAVKNGNLGFPHSQVQNVFTFSCSLLQHHNFLLSKMLLHKGRFVSKKHMKSLQSLCGGQQGEKLIRERRRRVESTAELFRRDHSTNIITRPRFSVQWREEESLIWVNTTILQTMCVQASFVGYTTWKSVWPGYSVFTVICPNCQHQSTVASIVGQKRKRKLLLSSTRQSLVSIE